jgi:hypothetical protein
MNLTKITSVLFFALFLTQAMGQNPVQPSRASERNVMPKHRFFVSTTYLSLTNFGENNVYMYELHAGYKITSKDFIAIKGATWSLFEPMGIPWGPHKMNEDEAYPGRVREYGIGVSYQRMLWKGLFASVQVLPLKRNFLDEDGNKIDEGFRLYTSYHVGYHISLFKDRFFLEPQVHCNFWPIDSKGPDGFKAAENKWNNFFLFEPNLFFGVNL